MEIFLTLVTSFSLSLITTPVVIKLAYKFGLVDNPKIRPHPAHLHQRIIPRAGGLAIFISILLSTLFFLPLDKHILGIIIGGTILTLVGLVDDKSINFSPYPRLLLQFLAAGVVVASGVGISFITNPLGGILRLDGLVYSFSFFGLHNIVLLADIFALFWIVWMMNTINWANGVDGQTPGFVAVAALIIGFYSLSLYQNGDPNQWGIALLSFIVAGASLGFLLFNWHPAKIFLGFSGTTLLGFLLATLSILSGAKLAIALLVLLVPAIDSIYTIIRRLISRKSPFLGDQKHLHHLLLKRGWSHQRISLFYITSCAILGVLAINLSSSGKLFTLVGAGVLVVGIITWLNFFGDLSKQPDQDSG